MRKRVREINEIKRDALENILRATKYVSREENRSKEEVTILIHDKES